MKKLIMASALSAAFVSPAVFAQATGFTGVYGQLGIGMNSGGTKSSAVDSASGTEIFGGDLGQQNVAGNVALGYNYTFSNGFNLGANVFYNISGDSAGSLNGLDEFGQFQLNNKLKNIWGISVEPGYSFSNDSLGYLKLGWAQGQNSWTFNDESNSDEFSLGTANGFLYGIGYKHSINKNVYVGVEVYQIAFSSQSRTITGDGESFTLKSTPNYTYGGLVIGARF